MRMASTSAAGTRATKGDLRVTVYRVDKKGPITGEASKSFRLYDEDVHTTADVLQKALAEYLERQAADEASAEDAPADAE